MKPFHILLAVMVTVIWGIAFVVSKIGLESFSPAQLTAFRFLVASLAVIWVPRPKISWTQLVAIGLTLFTGQFLLQFFGIANGMPAGLTAVVSQIQALFTVIFAAVILGDKPTRQQGTGMLLALAGLLMIGLNLGGTITFLSFALTLASAISWAIGNILIKQLRDVNALHLVVWASLVPPLPAFTISLVLDGYEPLLTLVATASWQAILAPLYLGILASVIAYAVWGNLLRNYPAGVVAPFALLSPCVGMLASAWVFDEKFSAFQLAGMICILAGVATVVLPWHYLVRRRAPSFPDKNSGAR